LTGLPDEPAIKAIKLDVALTMRRTAGKKRHHRQQKGICLGTNGANAKGRRS